MTLNAKQELHLTLQNDSQNILPLLGQASGLSLGQIKKAIQQGCLWHTKGQSTARLRRAKKSFKQGEQLHFYYNPEVLSQQVEPAVMIAQGNDYSVWFKPYGMLCQGSKWSDHTTIARFVETHFQPQRPVYMVHRLDRATSGLMVLAHTKSMASRLAKSFEQRQTKKIYHAIVLGDIRPCLQGKPLLTLDTPVAGKSALSHIKVLAYDEAQQRTKVAVQIDTGRKHQIRLHLSSIGFPIVGDRLYGDANASDLNLQLQSVYLCLPNIAQQNSQSDEHHKSLQPLEFHLPEAYHLRL
ncbi:pseudouridine synthase family protein [Thalassotalea aquiviva]|uniref:pseudouridine synthase family protein n=1 Tax=Thalassotalea aquiviva TaxID=3242415 RepID=UPI00352ACA7A